MISIYFLVKEKMVREGLNVGNAIESEKAWQTSQASLGEKATAEREKVNGINGVDKVRISFRAKTYPLTYFDSSSAHQLTQPPPTLVRSLHRRLSLHQVQQQRHLRNREQERGMSKFLYQLPLPSMDRFRLGFAFHLLLDIGEVNP